MKLLPIEEINGILSNQPLLAESLSAIEAQSFDLLPERRKIEYFDACCRMAVEKDPSKAQAIYRECVEILSEVIR